MNDQSDPVSLEIRRDESLEDQLMRMARRHGDLIVTWDHSRDALTVLPIADWPAMKTAARAAGESAWKSFWDVWRENIAAIGPNP